MTRALGRRACPSATLPGGTEGRRWRRSSLALLATLSLSGCSDEPSAGTDGGGGSGASSGTGAGGGQPTGGGGTGGAEPCGGACEAPTPLCDTNTNTCVACLGNGDCTNAAAARCEAGVCVGCQGAPDCTHLPGLGICDAATCVECTLGDMSACGGTQTCDLLTKACVDVAPGTVDTCEACTNDLQCIVGHKCVPLDYPIGTLHGYYCLATPACSQPYVSVADKQSINGEAPAIYCGLSEDFTTCEAVLALDKVWYCTGTDEMCSEEVGGTEVPVPGAICRDLFGGTVLGRCTYRCGTDADCPPSGDGRFCGDDLGTNPPDYCGGATN